MQLTERERVKEEEGEGGREEGREEGKQTSLSVNVFQTYQEACKNGAIHSKQQGWGERSNEQHLLV